MDLLAYTLSHGEGKADSDSCLPPVLTVSAVNGSDRLMVIVLPRVRVLYISGLQVGLFARRIDTMLE